MNTPKEVIKTLIEQQLNYLQKMAVVDTPFNEGQRDEAERTLVWLRDYQEVIYGKE